MKSQVDPHRGGHERFRVTKKNLKESSNLSGNSLNSLNSHNDSLDDENEIDYNWYPDNKI
jgi:hypothetical protein